MPKDLVTIRNDIDALKKYWIERDTRIKEWYEILVMVDQLAAKGLESYASNEPQTFYNMAHYLLTKGTLSHKTPLMSDSALELDRQSKINGACEYMWSVVDRDRKAGGSQAFIDELAFYELVSGWYSTVAQFDKITGMLKPQVWSPITVYPRFANNKLVSCVHSYTLTQNEAVVKATDNGWNYTPMGTVGDTNVALDDYFWLENETLYNTIMIDAKDVTGSVSRDDMKLLVAPIGGFPDRGSLSPSGYDWRRLSGRSIFEVDSNVMVYFNKWKTEMSQTLRDTVQSIIQEFSTEKQVTNPAQLTERGGVFHYNPGELGLKRLEPASIPIELQAHLLEIRREIQKGSFSDAVYGMMEGQPGYSLSLMATSSANQILYPYMDAKHFVISELDRFWLNNLKQSGKSFDVKGKFLIQIKSKDLPEDVSIDVESEVATPQDWLERGTIAQYLKDFLDEDTIVSDVLHQKDPQAIKRKRSLDRALNHPMSQNIELISGYLIQADYLDYMGDTRQAALFRKAAASLEAQMGLPAPGQASPTEATRVASQIAAGAPAEKPTSTSRVSPPEKTQGFSPAELRRMMGRGNLSMVRPNNTGG